LTEIGVKVTAHNSRDPDTPRSYFRDLLREAGKKGLNKRGWYAVAGNLAREEGVTDFIAVSTFYNWFTKRDRISDWEWSHSVRFVVYAAIGVRNLSR
jgi:hypothetical protein